jgi:hypothetical protein
MSEPETTRCQYCNSELKKKKDGGYAFPVPHSTDGNWQQVPLPEFRGMSLRDYFLGAAIQGMCANPNDNYVRLSWHDLALAANAIADEAVRQREARK